jgi:hypothetical protein
MLPTKEELVEHLSNKMTNQDIAKIYGLSFSKSNSAYKEV